MQYGIEASFIGIDGNPQSIVYANAQYGQSDRIKFMTADILDDEFHIPKSDLIISSHFVYHFKDEELLKFLRKAQNSGIKHLIFSELKRSRMAYVLFKYSSPVLPISQMAKKDGLVAIRRAFTFNELTSILDKSALKNYTISKKRWFRTLTQIET